MYVYMCIFPGTGKASNHDCHITPPNRGGEVPPHLPTLLSAILGSGAEGLGPRARGPGPRARGPGPPTGSHALKQ